MRELGVGIVGLSATGGWASAAHVDAIAAVEGIQLRAVAASSAGSARSAAAAFGVPFACSSVDELASRGDVDLVVVVVRVPRHRELVLPALAANKAVLCEWPLARTVGEAVELTEASSPGSFVGLQGRSSPVARYLRDLVANGYVGRVLSTSVLSCAPAWGDPVTTRDMYIVDRENGATMLSIPFGHTLDTVETVVGPLSSLSATTAVGRTEVSNRDDARQVAVTAEDQIAVACAFESAAVGSIHYRGGSTAGTKFLWEVNGTDGVLQIVNDASTLNRGAITVRGARSGDVLGQLPVPATYDAFPELRGTPAHVVAHSYAQIVRDLTDGTDLAPRFTDALRLHRILDKVSEAAATGIRQTVD